ncbi:MAG TPA: serine/threonine-protein kinase [Kofleriaceae bacterium]|nr:serine/threonine-protein kinase [Kofleriaceae bacterium]
MLDYQLGELLGQGGMGQVHAARHRSGRAVVIKRVRNTLSGNPLLAVRLADEARLLRAVSHPNVVRVLDHGTSQDGRPFLVMSHAHGTPLCDMIVARGPLPHGRVAAIALQLLAGLAAIHAAGVVHADLTSSNVLVDDVDIVTIIDFGLACTVSALTDTAEQIAGTPAYMAPEMIDGAYPTTAGDVYAAATIVYEMLTATTPYSGHLSTILARQLCEPVEPPSRRAPDRGISPAIDRVMLRALDRSPDARYPSATAFAEALDAALAGRPEPAIAAGSDLWRNPTRRGLAPTRSPAPSAASLPAPTACPESQDVGRHAIASSQARADAIISEALTTAHRLIDGHRLAEAAQALEAARAALAATYRDDEPGCSSAWRLETVLAALYDTAGKQDRARRMAMVAYRHAVRSGCPLAKTRTRELVDRLARQRGVSRGSSSTVG